MDSSFVLTHNIGHYSRCLSKARYPHDACRVLRTQETSRSTSRCTVIWLTGIGRQCRQLLLNFNCDIQDASQEEVSMTGSCITVKFLQSFIGSPSVVLFSGVRIRERASLLRQGPMLGTDLANPAKYKKEKKRKRKKLKKICST